MIELPNVKNMNGLITFISNADDFMPFPIQRIYLIRDVPKGAQRGVHGHIELQQLFIAVSGSFKIKIRTINESSAYTLDSPTHGLYVAKASWRELYDFSDDAVCLVLASLPYDKEDYYFDEYEFFEIVKRRQL